MALQATWILDASALLAFLHGEPGAEVVADALNQGALISAVNWAEVLTKLAELGETPEAVTQRLEKMGILGFAVEIQPFDESYARGVARLRAATREQGLSLGDRACLALADRLQLEVLTADRAWINLSLSLKIHNIR
jgi:PIN domain nuclease of toxin-antitoxin system